MSERQLLGQVLLEPTRYPYIEFMRFKKPEHIVIHSAMHALYHSRTPLDMITLVEWLELHNLLEKAGDVSYITGLVDGV